MTSRTLFLAVLGLASPLARADIAPLSGTQTENGRARAYQLSQLVSEQGFDISAPDPRASWSPPMQDVSAAAVAGAHVTTTYSSSIDPHAVTLSTHASFASTGNSQGGGNSGSVDYALTFSLRFTIDTSGPFEVSGDLSRDNSAGWIAAMPSTMSFGPEGQPPIFSIENDGAVPFPQSVTFGTYTVFLAAGTYVVQASDTDSWPGGHDNHRDSTMSFSLHAVPAPSAVLLFMFAAPLRRRVR